MDAIDQPDIVKIEHRAYSRGYSAGRKKLKQENQTARRFARQDEFWRRAFLTALPFALDAQSWSRGGKPITGIADRVKLAADVANEAVEQAKLATNF